MTIKTLSLTDDIYMLDGIYPKLPVFDLVQKYSRLQSSGTSEDTYIFYWSPVEYRTDFSVSKFTLEIDTVNTFDSTNKITYVDSVVGTSDLSISFPALDTFTLLIDDVVVVFTTNDSSIDLVTTKINTEVGKTVASKVIFGSAKYIKLTGCTLYSNGTSNTSLGFSYSASPITSINIANYYHNGNLVKGFEVVVFPRNINYDPSDTTLVRTDVTQPFYWRVKPQLII